MDDDDGEAEADVRPADAASGTMATAPRRTPSSEAETRPGHNKSDERDGFDVFMSYSWKNKQVVRQLKDHLARTGL